LNASKISLTASDLASQNLTNADPSQLGSGWSKLKFGAVIYSRFLWFQAVDLQKWALFLTTYKKFCEISKGSGETAFTSAMHAPGF